MTNSDGALWSDKPKSMFLIESEKTVTLTLVGKALVRVGGISRWGMASAFADQTLSLYMSVQCVVRSPIVTLPKDVVLSGKVTCS